MNKTISLGKAFAHCASTGSYWAWLGVALLIVIIGAIIIKKSLKTSDWSTGHIIGIFGLLVILLLAIFLRPEDIAANTTEEQAARGVFIGY